MSSEEYPLNRSQLPLTPNLLPSQGSETVQPQGGAETSDSQAEPVDDSMVQIPRATAEFISAYLTKEIRYERTAYTVDQQLVSALESANTAFDDALGD